MRSAIPTPSVSPALDTQRSCVSALALDAAIKLKVNSAKAPINLEVVRIFHALAYALNIHGPFLKTFSARLCALRGARAIGAGPRL